MKDYAFSIKFLNVVKRVVGSEMSKRHKIRIATVVSFDRPSLTCVVKFVESTDTPVTISMGAIQPRIAGQRVRVEYFDGDWFLTHVIDQGGFFAVS